MPVSRALLRQLMRRLLPTDPDFEAFCLDLYPSVSERLARGMDRLSKVNLLLEHVEAVDAFHRLEQHCGTDAMERALQMTVATAAVTQGPEVDALRDELERLYVIRAERRAQGRPTIELDEEIRRIKRIQRQKEQLREGEVLGDRYRLTEMIGKGGFAKVWQAFDRETKQMVAVKVLHAELAEDRSRVERFCRGARQIKGLQHPHLIRVLDGPAEEHGFHYFVMELLWGGDLHDAVLKERLSREAALRAVLQTGEALEYAHSQGLIHRDVKPQNILLDHTGSARLTDFDLVLAADTTGGTGTGAMGTFLYAAPEEIKDASRVDRRADVYALGMTTLFVLEGRPLTQLDILRRVVFIDELECSEPVRALLRLATAIDPDDRPASVAEFCVRLERALATPLLTDLSAVPTASGDEIGSFCSAR